MNLIRDLLLAVEAEQVDDCIRSNPSGPETAMKHVALLIDAGILAGTHHRGIGAAVTGMTWEGHDLLDAIRGEEVWAKTMEKVREVGGSVSIELIKNLATKAASLLIGWE